MYPGIFSDSEGLATEATLRGGQLLQSPGTGEGPELKVSLELTT